jgi:tetratricopeptide (TPR) repeat protein
VLERIGAWTLRDEPWVAEPDEDEAEPQAPLPAYEIEVGARGSTAGPQAGDRTGADARRGHADQRDADAKSTAFRSEIRERHSQLEELDHYAILGVEEKSGAGLIKRAYFKLAKRFHPDALARLGLEDVRGQAKEVFARIATAHEVLKDPAQRRDYDASRERGGDDLDAARLIQAESLFRKGEIMLGAGNFIGSLEFLKPAVELWPEEAEYQSALGWALFRKAPPDLGGARTHLELAVKCGPNNGEAHQRLSSVLRALEDFKGADAALARAKVLDPKL